jgi:hypothetical protein
MNIVESRAHLLYLCLAIYIAALLFTSISINITPSLFISVLFAFSYSAIPLFFWRGEKKIITKRNKKEDLLISTYSFLFLCSLIMKLYLRDYEITLNAVIMRDQMLSYKRSGIDVYLGIANTVFLGLILLRTLRFQFYGVVMGKFSITIVSVSFLAYLWNAGSRLSFVFILAILLSAGTKLKLNAKTIIFAAITFTLFLLVFELRAERSEISMYELILGYENWLQVENHKSNFFRETEQLQTTYVASLYVGHAFTTLEKIIQDNYLGLTQTLGGTIYHLLTALGINTKSSSIYSGLMHTELGYFVNELGWYGAFIALLIKVYIARLPTYNFQIYLIKLLIPMSAICSIFTSVFNFTAMYFFLVTILLSWASLTFNILIKFHEYQKQ